MLERKEEGSTKYNVRRKYGVEFSRYRDLGNFGTVNSATLVRPGIARALHPNAVGLHHGELRLMLAAFACGIVFVPIHEDAMVATSCRVRAGPLEVRPEGAKGAWRNVASGAQRLRLR